MAKKKKRTALEILEGFQVELDYLADELEVSRNTVRRWFKDSITKVNTWTLAPADEVITFLTEYQKGKYAEKLFEPYKPDDFKDKDIDGDDMYEIIKTVLEKLVFVADVGMRDENLDEIRKGVINHIYTINVAVY